MLGTRVEAEDVVQDTYLRWHQADQQAIRTPEAWLVTTATRLAIDRLRAARTAREAYVGPWLPEPIVDDGRGAPDYGAHLASGLSLAFLLVLERLAPEERAAFLLHDVFDASYADLAGLLGKSEATCRQMVTRARQRVRGERRRFAASPEEKRRLVAAFHAAVVARDTQTLLGLFAPDVTWTADGGGVTHASPRPLHGVQTVLRLALGIQRLYAAGGVTLHAAMVNGEPGLIARHGHRIVATYAVDVADGVIGAVYVVLNPEKLPA